MCYANLPLRQAPPRRAHARPTVQSLCGVIAALWYERLSPGHPFPRAPTATLRGLPSGSFLDNDNIAEPTHEHIRLLVGKFSLTLHFFFCNWSAKARDRAFFGDLSLYYYRRGGISLVHPKFLVVFPFNNRLVVHPCLSEA